MPNVQDNDLVCFIVDRIENQKWIAYDRQHPDARFIGDMSDKRKFFE